MGSHDGATTTSSTTAATTRRDRWPRNHAAHRHGRKHPPVVTKGVETGSTVPSVDEIIAWYRTKLSRIDAIVHENQLWRHVATPSHPMVPLKKIPPPLRCGDCNTPLRLSEFVKYCAETKRQWCSMCIGNACLDDHPHETRKLFTVPLVQLFGSGKWNCPTSASARVKRAAAYACGVRITTWMMSMWRKVLCVAMARHRDRASPPADGLSDTTGRYNKELATLDEVLRMKPPCSRKTMFVTLEHSMKSLAHPKQPSCGCHVCTPLRMQCSPAHLLALQAVAAHALSLRSRIIALVRAEVSPS